MGIITAAIEKALTFKGNFMVPNLAQTENKWRQLKFSYKKHVDMLEKSGDVGEAIRPKPSYFDEVDEILGLEHNIRPTFTIDSFFFSSKIYPCKAFC